MNKAKTTGVVPHMDIVMHSMGMPFNGDTIKTQSLGGSESAAYYQARELAYRGHRVVMFTNSKDEGEFDGVIYCWSGETTQQKPLGDRFTQFACNTPHDVLIIQRHHLAFHKDYASKINVLQLHDISLRRFSGAMNAGGARIDLVTAVSEFHKQQIHEVYGFREGLVKVVPNGVDLELYDPNLWVTPSSSAESAVDESRLAGNMNYLYQSRPERGLEHLVRPGGIMHRLHECGSKAQLFVCGYDYTTDSMRAYYEQMYAFCRELPNVTLLGALTKADLARVQCECDALVYPTEFEEVSCITAMEAMAAGLPFISSACAALPETCKDSGSILLPLKDGKADEDAFVDSLLLFEQDAAGRAAYSRAQHEASDTRSWEHAVDALEQELQEAFSKRQDPARMARHLIEHSDISALDVEVQDNSFKIESSKIIRQTLAERDEMYEFADPVRAVAHYEKWEGMNCDRMEARGLNPEAERDGITRTTRFQGIFHGVSSGVKEKLAAGLPVRVLEFGCAHGHITLALAEALPNVTFVGVDFMSRSIAMATETAKKWKLGNVSFQQGSLELLPSLGSFDVVVAAEVIEHILDWKGAIRDLMSAVSTGGSLVTTTPTGRWEWSGRDWWPKGREHLHHFERQDLVEIFQEFRPEILHAPGGHDLCGGALGSWVVSVKNQEGARLRGRNYDRKLSVTAPRDTVSLCMIVKNAEHTIGRALHSVAGFVDEVVIAVDDTTEDRTFARLNELVGDYPHVSFTIVARPSPLSIGFDEARNWTIDNSCGDWIFWMDADEEVIDARNLWRCLRPGAFNAYSIQQHHMSQTPPGVLAVDHPCRMFRRDSGARFFGVVHEHPEVIVGGAIPHSQALPDVRIMHYGYTDESARRGRYQRNFPLLIKDLNKNPARTLNKFLYLRDLSQAIAFEGEQYGSVSGEMIENAKKVVRIFSDMIDTNPMLRMTLDAIPYYSTASATLMSAESFHAKIKVETKKDELQGLSATVDIEGLFHNRETYTRLLAKIAQETTANYEARYL